MHSLARCVSACPCTNSLSLSGKSGELDKHGSECCTSAPAGCVPRSLTLTEREHFWGGLLEWPSSWPCSLRNPVTWSKKEVTSNWCHSTSFWPRVQKASNKISAKRCSLVVKHTNSLLQESVWGTAASHRLPPDNYGASSFHPLEKGQTWIHTQFISILFF